MTRNNSTYSDDILASFEDVNSQKQAKAIAKDFQNLQKNFYPGDDFKNSLLKRLESTHSIDLAQNTGSFSNVFRMFSTVFSLIFVFGIIYMLYDARQIDIYDETMIIEKKLHDDMPEGVGHKDEILHNEIEPIQDGDDFTPLSEEQLNSPEDIIQEDVEVEDSSPVPDYTESVEFTIEKKPSEILEESLFFESQILDQDVSDESQDSGKEDNENDINESRSSQSVEVNTQNFSTSDDNNEYQQSEDMNEYQADESFYQEDFSQICESYAGVYNPESNSCEFSDGRVCYEEDFYSCAER